MYFESEEADLHFRPRKFKNGRVENYLKTNPCLRAFLPPRAFLAARTFAGRWHLERDGLFHLEAFQDVTHLHVRKIRHTDTALKTLAHFVGIFLEALQRADSAGVNYYTVA